MLILRILVTGIFLSFIFSCNQQNDEINAQSLDKPWEKIFSIAKIISNDNQSVSSDLLKAYNDKGILKKNSIFRETAKNKYQDNYIEWLDADSDLENVPSAVFKTVLYGHGFMGYIDWKVIYDAKEVFWSLNKIFDAANLGKSNDNELSPTIAKLSSIKDDTQRANAIIEQCEKFCNSKGRTIIWLDEGSDSYIFFIVPIDTISFH